MSGYIFRRLVLFCLLSGLAARSHAQVLRSLIPDAGIVQYAGSIGYFSAGISYDLFKNQRGNVDLLYGYVPENKGGALDIITLKFAYKPWELKIGDNVKIYPANPGVFLTYTFHPDLSYAFDTDQYPKNYYYWSEAIRPHLSVSNEIEINTRKLLPGMKIKAISIYSEFNTNDYYVVNYFQNMSALNIADIFQLGIGLKVKF